MKERANATLRFLDSYLGVPLLLFLSLFKWKRRALPEKVVSIALLKAAGIGDTVLLKGIILDLKERFPKKKITLFTGTTNQEMGKLLGVEVIALPMSRPWRALKIVRKKRFSLFIDCDAWPKITAILTFFSRSNVTIGFRRKNQLRHFLYDHKVEHTEFHELTNFRALIKPLGVTSHHAPKLNLLVPSETKRRVALHFFSGGSRAYLKAWDESKWQEVISFLKSLNVQILLTGGPSDADRLKKFEDVSVINCAGMTLEETSAALTTCLAVVSVDTGIMHLAAALGLKVIALHGPTSPKRWGGVGENVIAITPKMTYRPCLSLGFEKRCKKNLCMQAIDVQDVKEVLRKIIEASDENCDLSGGRRKEAVAPF